MQLGDERARFLPALSASAKLICRFIVVVGSFRELSSTTSSAASEMTTEPDKSAFPNPCRRYIDVHRQICLEIEGAADSCRGRASARANEARVAVQFDLCAPAPARPQNLCSRPTR
ncbi:hypothetical protein CO709_08060 [Burkholderia thailandensis]|nr:hypothetical protein CO709_08060 [Burkholderia thailandensis]